MDRFLRFLELNNYLSLLMNIISIFGFFISIKKRNRFPHLRYFPIYFLLSLAQTCLFGLYIINDDIINTETANASTKIFILCEYFILTNFFFNLKLSGNIQRLILFLSIGFYLTILGIWIVGKNFFDRPYEIFILEAVFIIPLALTYFYSLFKNPPIKTLSQDFAFWISTGILFYFTITLPLFLIHDRIYGDFFDVLYEINYLAYAVLFVLIIKGYLCKPQLAK